MQKPIMINKIKQVPMRTIFNAIDIQTPRLRKDQTGLLFPLKNLVLWVGSAFSGYAIAEMRLIK
jgi:hypothetical protein